MKGRGVSGNPRRLSKRWKEAHSGEQEETKRENNDSRRNMQRKEFHKKLHAHLLTYRDTSAEDFEIRLHFCNYTHKWESTPPVPAIRAARPQVPHPRLPTSGSHLSNGQPGLFFIRFVKVTPIYYTNTIAVNTLVYSFAIFLPTHFSGVTGVPYQVINYMYCLDLNRSECLALRRRNPGIHFQERLNSN